METTTKEHLGWIDLLRVLACFLVVLSHCCDPFVAQFDADRSAFLTGMFTGSTVRCCVPLFVMMTGVLLLPVQTGMSAFYRKRIGRIALPLVFWSLALPALYCVYLNCGGTTSNPQVVMEDHTLRATLTKLYTFVFNFNYDTTPLWYLYMLVGLYLIMPILSVWLQQASRRDLKFALWLWGATLVLPYIGMAAPMLGYAGNYGNPGILGVCDWNPYGTFYYVSGFAGYLVLAYYLVKYPPAWSWRRTLALGIPMFAAGYAHGIRLSGHAEPLSGQLRLPRDCLVLYGHQRLSDDVPGLSRRAETAAETTPMARASGIADLRHLFVSFHFRADRLRLDRNDRFASGARAHRADGLLRFRGQRGAGVAHEPLEMDMETGPVADGGRQVPLFCAEPCFETRGPRGSGSAFPG